MQKRAARFVTGNYNYETGSMTGILGQLKWESLKKRRKDNRLILLSKGLKGKASVPTSVMAQNIQLFGPRDCFLTRQWIITGNKQITDKYYDKAKMRTRQKRVATDIWSSLGCRTTPLEHWSKRKPTVEPRWAKQQTKKLRPKPAKINSFTSGPSLSLTPDPPACN